MRERWGARSAHERAGTAAKENNQRTSTHGEDSPGHSPHSSANKPMIGSRCADTKRAGLMANAELRSEREKMRGERSLCVPLWRRRLAVKCWLKGGQEAGRCLREAQARRSDRGEGAWVKINHLVAIRQVSHAQPTTVSHNKPMPIGPQKYVLLQENRQT